MSNTPNVPDNPGNEEEELIRSEFESIVSGLSLDESAPTTYLDELERIDRSEVFIPPNPPTQSPRTFFFSARNAILRWFKRGYHDDDGVEL